MTPWTGLSPLREVALWFFLIISSSSPDVALPVYDIHVGNTEDLEEPRAIWGPVAPLATCSWLSAVPAHQPTRRHQEPLSLRARPEAAQGYGEPRTMRAGS